MRRRRLPLALLVALMLGAAAAQISLSIVTGDTGGVYYPVGSGYAVIVEEYLDGYDATVQATNGSVNNVTLVARGEADIGLALADTALAAYEGTGPFGEGGELPRLDNLRVITVAYTNALHVITRADSGIASLADLVGKRVSLGAPGSGTEVSATSILTALGIDLGAMQVERLGLNETVTALSEGAIDAGFWSGGLPTAAVRDLAAATQISLVPISDEEVAVVTAANPTLTRYTIPADTYGGVGETPTIGTPNLVVVAAQMQEQLAYDFTKALFEHIDVVREIHPTAAETVPEAALTSPLPLHAGAIRYFEELGLSVPADLKVD